MGTFETISQILKNNNLTIQEAHKQIFHIAWEIFADWKNKTKDENNFCDFIYHWKIFGSKQIPFELWSDICEEGLKLLNQLLENPSIPYKELPGFSEFDEKVYERVKELKFKHGFQDRFTMDAYN
jgi:hypothetical protein